MGIFRKKLAKIELFLDENNEVNYLLEINPKRIVLIDEKELLQLFFLYIFIRSVRTMGIIPAHSLVSDINNIINNQEIKHWKSQFLYHDRVYSTLYSEPIKSNNKNVLFVTQNLKAKIKKNINMDLDKYSSIKDNYRVVNLNYEQDISSIIIHFYQKCFGSLKLDEDEKFISFIKIIDLIFLRWFNPILEKENMFDIYKPLLRNKLRIIEVGLFSMWRLFKRPYTEENLFKNIELLK